MKSHCCQKDNSEEKVRKAIRRMLLGTTCP